MFVALLLCAVMASADQMFNNMYGQPLPWADEQDAFRAEQVLHGLNIKYKQLSRELYKTRFSLRALMRRRYFASSPIELSGSEHDMQFLKLKTHRLRRTIIIILKQMGKTLASLNRRDRNLVVMHLRISPSTIMKMKTAIKSKIPAFPSHVPPAYPTEPRYPRDML
ncbi:Uncharacterized protein QTN25_000484 [Entamoeba marina]